MRVQERPDVGDITSVSEIPVIISLAREEQYNAEAWAKGTKNGIAVTSEDTQYNNHAKYWAEQAAQSAQEFAGGVIYKGSVAFANIPTSGMKHGWMYNVTDDFTTDSRFTEGAGIFCLAGQNIVWNNDISKWDLAARGGVSSFNGRYGAITPTSGDYSAAQVTANETIGGVAKTNVGDAISALNSVKVDKHQTGGVDDRLMTSAEATKLEGIEAQANKTVVDSALSDSSTNPVQNKVVKEALDLKANITDIPTVPGAYTNTPEMDGVGSAGTSSSYAKGDHKHPSDTSKTDLSVIADAFDAGGTYAVDDYCTHDGILYRFIAPHTGAWSSADVTPVKVVDELGQGGGGGASPYTSNPEMDGIASPGNSNQYARGNHVHPTDTSRMAKAGDTMTGALTVQNNITATGEITDGSSNVLSEKYDANSFVLQNFRLTVPASGWSSTAVDGYYTQTVALSYPLNTYKEVDINPTGADDSTEQTSAEAVAYSCLKHVKYAEGTGVTSVTLYASTKPTTTFYCMVSGYYITKNAATSGVAQDITTANKLNVYDGNGNKVAEFNGSATVNIYHRSKIASVPSTGWSSVVDANGYYTQYINLMDDYNTYDTPDIYLCGSTNDTKATAAEQAAWSLIDRVWMADSTATHTLVLYAKTKPTTTFYIRVKGSYIG